MPLLWKALVTGHLQRVPVHHFAQRAQRPTTRLAPPARDWTAWKDRMHDLALPLPKQRPEGIARCICGA
jgi:hypothetical protein